MSTLRKATIRLAFENEALRPQLLSILKKAGERGAVEPVLGTALDYKTKMQAMKIVNKLLYKYTQGFFRDEYWKPLSDTRKAFEQANIHIVVSDPKYHENDEGVPTSKTWNIEVPYINQAGKPAWLFGTFVASGAGSVESPLDKYDVVAYVN